MVMWWLNCPFKIFEKLHRLHFFIELNLVFSNWKFWNFFKQKLKEEREAKRAQLDGRHDYILSIVASCLGLEKADVEDAILEGNQVLCT